MKKLTKRSIMIVSLAMVLASCGSKKSLFNIPSVWNNDAYGLTGRQARKVYRGLTTTSIGSLNYLKTAQNANATHFANFVDGLLIHNAYGILEKNLADKVTHNEDYTEFAFTVKSNVPWQHYDGTQYEATIDGNKVKQFVSADDWVTTAKTILSYSNASELTYLLTSFIRGTQAYYEWTQIYYKWSNDMSPYKQKTYNIDDDAVVAESLNELIKKENPTVWASEYDNGASAIEAEDVAGIKSGANLGIQATEVTSNGGGVLTYKLYQKAPYFPTLFTYSCYLPLNEHFIKEVRWSGFGTTQDSILYNGPYLLSEWSETRIEYTANDKYFNKDNVYAVDKVDFTVINDTSIITPEYTREQFESDQIDGFTVSMKDSTGWSNYITGGEGGDGSFENPVSPYVNSRLLDTIGSMYGSNIVMDRKNAGNNKSYYSKGSASTVANTAKAFQLNAVREAVLKSPDLEFYYDKSFESLDPSIREQYKVYTYVPKGFVQDDDGKDYVTTEYYKVYAEKKGLEVGDPENPVEGTAAYELKPGQVATGNVNETDFKVLLENAEAAIDAYNAANSSDKISTPVNLEYYCAWYDDDAKEIDTAIIENMNQRLNLTGKGYFKVVPTDLCTSKNYQTISGSSGGKGAQYDFSIINWGWGADYGDPLTFLNTYHQGSGDWASIFPFVAEEYVANYDSVLDEDGKFVSLAPVNNLLGSRDSDGDNYDSTYSGLVDLGAQETEDFNKRYDYFAQAEYKLVEEMNFYKPQVNYGQGWSFSVSRSAGYYVPQSAYGLSNERLTGMYVLDQVMTREDRQAARAAQDAAKEVYIANIDTDAGNSAAVNIY